MRLGLLELLTVVFVTLKLADVIDWSWWWVLSPVLVPIACVFVVAVFVAGTK